MSVTLQNSFDSTPKLFLLLNSLKWRRGEDHTAKGEQDFLGPLRFLDTKHLVNSPAD